MIEPWCCMFSEGKQNVQGDGLTGGPTPSTIESSLTPLDFYLFPALKVLLSGRSSQNNAEVHNTLEKPEESNVDLSCNPRVIEKIYTEYPTSVLFWTKDGKVLKVQLERMEVNLQQLTIQNLTLEDNGVYLCSMSYAPEVMKPVAVISLAVIPKTPIKVPEEESVSLSCGGAQLGTIYKDLTRSWFFENQVYKDFGNSSLLKNKEFEIANVTTNMTGTWRCRIRDPKRGWAWTINIVRIETLPPLPWYLKLLRRKTFLAMIGTSLLIVLLTLCLCIGYQISKAREGYLADFYVWRQIAEYETPSADEFESGSDEEVSLISNDCQVIYSQFGLAIHQNDQEGRRFVEWAQNEIAVVPDFHKRISFSDEAHFWLNGYVNKQNCRIWSEANPQVYVETPLHPKKLTVWCALWAGGIIGPYFFKNEEGHNELWFQQDGATCHTARATIDLLKDTFGDRLISRFGPVNWPPRSCDLTPLDYFLWDYVKSLVYADKPQTLDHLEDNIRRVIADIRPQILEKVIENWTTCEPAVAVVCQKSYLKCNATGLYFE
ncbi:thrombospondin-1 [Trichonephila clavipes]|nr:thrombospondin-1 [Trichonephila clavipes]